MSDGPKSSGRPRTFDTDKVVDGALELFWRDGYAATTTRTLESELGVTQSSLYNAFGSKRALLDKTLTRYQERVTSRLLVPLEESTEGLGSLATFFTALSRWISRDGRRGCMLINLMAEDGGETDEVSSQTRSYRSRMRRAFRGALERAADVGELRANDQETGADLLVALVLGLNIAARGGASSGELRGMSLAIRAQIDSWRSS